MSFLLTSLSALREDAFVHLNHRLSVHAERFGQAIAAEFGGHEGPGWSTQNGIIALCAAAAGEDRGSTTKRALQLYSRKSFPSTNDAAFPPDVPCTLYDAEIGYAWISADIAGSLPVWYALEESQFMVTTDLLAAYRSGFSEPTALGPGQVLLLDVNAHEVVEIKAASPVHTHNTPDSDILEAYTRRLGLAAVDALSTAVADVQVSYTVEVDMMDSSSLFLACALDALKVDHTVRYTRPRVLEDVGSSVQDAAFQRAVAGIPTSFMQTQQAAAREESFLALAAEQWRVCQAAVDIIRPAVLLSFETGMHPRPVAVYLQNLFCAALNVTVRYPFRDAAFQSAVWATRHPNSYFHEALEVLRSPQLAPGISMGNDTGAHMAPFCSSPGHGAREWSLSDLSPCSGKACVDVAILHGDGHTGWHVSTDGSLVGNTPSDTPKVVPNSLLRIHRATQAHASEDGTIVLLLASRGYADMLTNFLCAARLRGIRNFLVLTHDEEIISVARTFGVGVYSPAAVATGPQTLSDADFGTVQYQRLVFSRTELAMDLLLAGYQPVIADIDAVWLSNPLLHLPWATAATSEGIQYDVAITDDSGEVCGCFIALRNTDRAVRFWHDVYVAHKKLIEDALQTGQFLVFDESEQKIVTQLLYKGGYKSELFVYRLPDELFPSGHAYFTLQAHRVQPTQPVVVHNNYIVGEALKKARFQRHGLWSTLQQTSGSPSPDGPVCIPDAGLEQYRAVFTVARRNVSIPSLNLYSPVHNSVLQDSNNAIVHVSAEGPLSIRITGAAADYRFPPANVYVDRNPPAHMAASPAVFADLKMAPAVNHSVLAFTVTTRSEDVSINADVGFHRSDFSVDRAGRFAQRAEEVVLYNQRISEAGNAPAGKSGWAVPYLDAPSVVPGAEPSEAEATEDEQESTDEAAPLMRYSIRVLTYNRPQSLQRLLTSLALAEYGTHRNIALYISVDGARGVQDEEQRRRCIEIAQNFLWEFGTKIVKPQANNIGLKQQWLQAWHPAEDDQEAAFIFEDDMEVSPYFFTWATRAVEKYYVGDSNQRRLHRHLLRAVRAEAAGNSSASEQPPLVTPLQRFAEAAAGKPLLYGVCLQRQYLDPNHYPRPLRVRNNHRPFLYSLIGSWGPLMLPRAWLAFLEWQQGKADEPIPETENLVTNHFATENPRIWTPWHIRFAYETGAKCLYPNLPGRFALVVNHREQGENYAAVAGPDGDLIPAGAGVDNAEMVLDATSLASSATEANSPGGNLWSALWNLPDMSVLAAMQFDFNLRRAGAMGKDAAYRVSDALVTSGPERLIAEERINTAMRWHTLYCAEITKTTSGVSLPASTYSAKIGAEHWVHIVDMVIETVPSSARILHLTHTPLIALLPTQVNAYQQDILQHPSTEARRTAWATANPAAGFTEHNQAWARRAALVADVAEVEGISYAMLVMDLHAVSETSTRSGLVLASVTSRLSAPEFLLVLGPCTAAPTDLEVAFRPASNSKGPPPLSAYMMVQDFCAIGAEDVGAVLYRLAEKSDIPADKRFMVSRRLAGGFQTRRLVNTAGLT